MIRKTDRIVLRIGQLKTIQDPKFMIGIAAF